MKYEKPQILAESRTKSAQCDRKGPSARPCYPPGPHTR